MFGWLLDAPLAGVVWFHPNKHWALGWDEPYVSWCFQSLTQSVLSGKASALICTVSDPSSLTAGDVCLCYWTSLPVFRLFLQFILCSVARFIFQNMKSYSSNQNLHSWIKSKPLNLAFNDYQNLAPINLYGLIAIFSNYKSLGFCQISLLSSHLPWTFYIEASHLCHKEFLPLPSSCHCSRPFCISTFIT